MVGPALQGAAMQGDVRMCRIPFLMLLGCVAILGSSRELLAQQPGGTNRPWEADRLTVSLRRELLGPKTKKLPTFDHIYVEVTGTFRCSTPNRSVTTNKFYILKADPKNPGQKRIPDDFEFIGVGAPGEEGASYPAFDSEMRLPLQSVKLPLGEFAVLEKSRETMDTPTVKVLGSSAPLALAFRFPTPKQSSIKLVLQFDGLEFPLPDLQLSAKDIGWEIPKEQQAAAKKAFGAKLAFFLWAEKGAAKAKDFQLRFAVNPAIAMEDLLSEDNIATRCQLVYTGNGQRVPLTSTYNGHFGISASDIGGSATKFKGRGSATLCLLRASNDPKKDPALVKPISNEITVPIVFD
jgi:hypothetical protein